MRFCLISAAILMAIQAGDLLKAVSGVGTCSTWRESIVLESCATDFWVVLFLLIQSPFQKKVITSLHDYMLAMEQG